MPRPHSALTQRYAWENSAQRTEFFSFDQEISHDTWSYGNKPLDFANIFEVFLDWVVSSVQTLAGTMGSKRHGVRLNNVRYSSVWNSGKRSHEGVPGPRWEAIHYRLWTEMPYILSRDCMPWNVKWLDLCTFRKQYIFTRDGNFPGWICARGGSLFATMYKGLLFESDISFKEMTRPGSLCNTVKMSI